MIQSVSFKGVFTIDEHIKVLEELNGCGSKCGKQYDCQVYKDQASQIHIELKEVTQHAR